MENREEIKCRTEIQYLFNTCIFNPNDGETKVYILEH